MPRPSAPKLPIDAIVDAATELAEYAGDPFAMAQIAAALDVRPSSLYNHVASRAEAVDLICRRLPTAHSGATRRAHYVARAARAG